MGVEIHGNSRLNGGLFMANPVKTFLVTLTRKCAMSMLVGLLALAAYSLWLYGKEPASFEVRRARLIATTHSELTALQDEQVQLSAAKSETAAALVAQQSRHNQAEKALKTLHALDPNMLERVWGDAETQKTHAERVARMEKIKAESAARSVALQCQLRDEEAGLRELNERHQRVERTHLAATVDGQAGVHYLRTAWHEARWLVVGVICAYLFGRFVLSLFWFYAVAPRVTRGQAVQLAQANGLLPVVEESALSAESALWPGEVLRVRPQYLQSHDEGLTQRSCPVLNWRRAFSCLASGLTGLIELRNSRNAGERSVLFASRTDPFAELSIVSVPEGGSFILRAGFLMGVITPGAAPVTIHRHLRLFHWQSWVSGRFGYWEFVGPCRLIVSCVSAVSVEFMKTNEAGEFPPRRTAQAGVVGFSPQLALKPVRCSGFWRYYRLRRPLYEVEITGCGVFLASESGVLARSRMRGNEGPLVKLLKLVGL